MNIKKILTVVILVSFLLVGQTVTPTHAASPLFADPHASFDVCTSWATVCSLQYALFLAGPGDQIWAKQGTYLPPGDRSASFDLKNGVTIYGGFIGTETLLTDRDPVAHPSILSGDIGTGGTSSDNSYHVIDGSNTDSTAVLDGFTITAGNANGGLLDSGGGGMIVVNGSPTLINLSFTGNSGDSGGGIAISNGTPALMAVTFNNNNAHDGGAVFDQSSNPTLTNVTIAGNKASGLGGGMYNLNSNPTLLNVTFSGNSATNGGGGIFNGSSNPNISDSIIWNGGLTTSNTTSSPAIEGTHFWGETSKSHVNFLSNGNIADSIVSGGCPSNANCTHVLGSNPLLTALDQNGGFTETMALTEKSPALNAGNNSTCASTDQRGVSRPQGIRCDMGAFEAYPLSMFPSSATQDGSILQTSTHTGIGGSLNTTSKTLPIGDNGNNSQYVSIVSFNTASLPDAGTIHAAQLRLRFRSIQPVVPNFIGSMGGIMIDIKTGYFGASQNLELGDYQAVASKTVGPYFPVLITGGFYTINLSSSTFAYINKLTTNGGLTQIRLRFKMKTNNNNNKNILYLASGNDSAGSNRPQLLIYVTP